MSENAPIVTAFGAITHDGDLYCTRCNPNEDSEDTVAHDEEFDEPHHCGNGERCKAAIRLSDGSLIGALLDLSLSPVGREYVAQTEGEIGALWREHFNVEIAEGTAPFEGEPVDHCHWSPGKREEFERAHSLDAGGYSLDYLDDMIAQNLRTLNTECANPIYPQFAAGDRDLWPQILGERTDADLIIFADQPATVFPPKIVDCAGYEFRLLEVFNLNDHESECFECQGQGTYTDDYGDDQECLRCEGFGYVDGFAAAAAHYKLIDE